MEEKTQFHLPAMSFIGQSFAYVAEERNNFFAMALLPVVALSIIGSLALHFFPDPLLQLDQETGAPQINLIFLPLILISTVFYAMFAVAWHRKWLLGESEITIYSALKWDGRKSRFFIRLLQIFGLSFGAMFALGIFLAFLPGTQGFIRSPFGVVLALAILTLLFARLSLLLPAAAVDDDRLDIISCWAKTNGNSWRLGVLAILPPIPLAFVQIIFHTAIYSLLDGLNLSNGLFAQLILHLVEHVLNYIGIAVGVSALSMAYVAFKEQPDPTPSEDD